MLRCMTQFDANYAESQLSAQSDNPVERIEADKEVEGQLSEYEIVAISDDEGDLEIDSDGINEQDENNDRTLNYSDLNKALDQEIDSVELPLQPVVRIIQSDSQRPHRERKRRRDEDEYEYSTQPRRRI